MPMRMPVETTNLDRYGNDALPWERAKGLLASSPTSSDITFFLGTVGANGKPHAAGIGALWCDDNLWFVSGPRTRKSRDLAASPACTIAVRLQGLDLILEGEAIRVIERSVLEQLAGRYRESGWPAEVDERGDAFTAPYNAPAAGPPPWYLYHLRVHTALGTAGVAPHGATRWRFDAVVE